MVLTTKSKGKKKPTEPRKPTEETYKKVIKALKSNKLISRHKLTRHGVDWKSLKIILDELIEKGDVEEIEEATDKKLYKWIGKKGFFDF